jgi:SAM-dependent methyltransferase
MVKHYIRKQRHRIRVFIFRLQNLRKERFECPICGYRGPFEDVHPSPGLRKHAKCPSCGSLERHRLQYLVIQKVLQERNASQMKMLHVAPEPFFREFFSQRFAKYETADLERKNVDYNVDLQSLPFADSTYDFVFASHVLEHIQNDKKALEEIRRVLRPNGIAFLPVPLVSEKSIEYPKPNPHEFGHVRAPGLDYFNRYLPHFSKVEQYASDSLPEKYQLFIYEDRSKWPTDECPLRPSMDGEKHSDVVPVCYA